MRALEDLRLGRDGAAVLRAAADGGVVASLSERFDQVFGGGRAGARLGDDERDVIERVACLPEMRECVERVLGADARAVRGLLFDKSLDANWDVAWHRDTAIAVRERREVDGYGPWSVKRGVVHVRPPAWVLAGMVTVRLHLDDCPAERGALMIAPGSHLDEDPFREDVDADLLNERAAVMEARAGDAVVMRPLVMHASRRNTLGGRRRVIHVEFAGCDLDGGLEWAW